MEPFGTMVYPMDNLYQKGGLKIFDVPLDGILGYA
jgi:hypothetical protein